MRATHWGQASFSGQTKKSRHAGFLYQEVAIMRTPIYLFLVLLLLGGPAGATVIATTTSPESPGCPNRYSAPPASDLAGQ